MHWNANSIDTINGKFFEFKNFILKKQPLLISINVTKLSHQNTIILDNYTILRLDRNAHGGGVAIFIANGQQFEQINLLDEFNL